MNVRIIDDRECGQPRALVAVTTTPEHAAALAEVGHIYRCRDGCAENVHHPATTWDAISAALERLERSA